MDDTSADGTTATFTFLADSARRDKSVNPSPGEYTVSFNAPFKNVVGFELLEVNIPRTDYILDSAENVLTYCLSTARGIATWAEDLADTRTAVFTPGDYNLPQLIEHVNAVLANVAAAHGDSATLVVVPTTTPAEVSNRVRFECSAPFSILADRSSIRGTLGFGDPVNLSNGKYACVPGYTVNFQNGASGVFSSVEGALGDGSLAAAFTGPLPGVSSYDLYSTRKARQYFTAAVSGTPTLVAAYLSSSGSAPVGGWPVDVRIATAAGDTIVATGTLLATGDAYEPSLASLTATGRLVAGQGYYVELVAQNGTGAPGGCAGVYFSEPNLPTGGAYATVDDGTGFAALPDGLLCVDVLAGAWGHQITAPGIVSLVGAKYLKIRCPELEQHINRDRVGEPTTAGVGLVNLVGYGFMNQRYNFVHYPPIRFHPIGKVQRLTFRLERPDGTPYDAQGVDNNLLCAITYRVPPKDASGFAYPAAPGYSPDYVKMQQRSWREQADSTRKLEKAGACYPAPRGG